MLLADLRLAEYANMHTYNIAHIYSYISYSLICNTTSSFRCIAIVFSHEKSTSQQNHPSLANFTTSLSWLPEDISAQTSRVRIVLQSHLTFACNAEALRAREFLVFF